MTLIPEPQKMELLNGQFWLRDGLTIRIDPVLPQETRSAPVPSTPTTMPPAVSAPSAAMPSDGGRN